MKVYTHMTLRLESLASSLGIDPVSWLLFKRLSRDTTKFQLLAKNTHKNYELKIQR
jgi:hypothetical protein